MSFQDNSSTWINRRYCWTIGATIQSYGCRWTSYFLKRNFSPPSSLSPDYKWTALPRRNTILVEMWRLIAAYYRGWWGYAGFFVNYWLINLLVCFEPVLWGGLIGSWLLGEDGLRLIGCCKVIYLKCTWPGASSGTWYRYSRSRKSFFEG